VDDVRAAPIALLVALTAAAWFAPPGAATSECHGIKACIEVPGPWVVVPAHGRAQYLLNCPGGDSVVGGLDARATSRTIHVSFEGRLGAPVQPGQTTTRHAFYRAVSTSAHTQVFQPLLGCIPSAREGGSGQGGGPRSTVSARVVTPVGLPPDFRARVVAIAQGDMKTAHVSCLRTETRVGAWHAIAFRTKKPPNLQQVGFVQAQHALVGNNQVAVTALASEALSSGLRALVQVGTECAPH
jgi:hypothetical protein